MAAKAVIEVNKVMETLKTLKIKTGSCKRILKELHSYEKEVDREAAKTAAMKERGADPYDLKQQENVLAESRMMLPDCRKRLEAASGDLQGLLEGLEQSSEGAEEILEAKNIVKEVEALFETSPS